MTKQTEAMKLALEALEGAEALLLSMGLTHLIVYGDAEKAIAALREALALVNEVDQEQPAQDEPVAWISTGPARMIHWTSDIPAYGDDWIPLYTSPPAQRTWVGLTDEEMQALWDRYAHMEMMRAIEAKLKAKNSP